LGPRGAGAEEQPPSRQVGPRASDRRPYPDLRSIYWAVQSTCTASSVRSKRTLGHDLSGAGSLANSRPRVTEHIAVNTAHLDRGTVPRVETHRTVPRVTVLVWPAFAAPSPALPAGQTRSVQQLRHARGQGLPCPRRLGFLRHGTRLSADSPRNKPSAPLARIDAETRGTKAALAPWAGVIRVERVMAAIAPSGVIAPRWRSRTTTIHSSRLRTQRRTAVLRRRR